MKKILIVLLCALCCTSCATILSGTTKHVTFDSDLKKADVVNIDGNRYKNVTFPFKAKVRCGFDDSFARFEADNLTSTVNIYKKFNWVSILNLADPVCWIIDAVSGAIMTTDQSYYWVEFEPQRTTTTKVEVTEIHIE